MIENNFFSARNFLAKGLGIFWILDGLLQLQPKMFGQDFVTTVLAPNLDGQPNFLHSLITSGINLFDLHTVLFNLFFVVIQIAIGILLLFPETSKKFRTGLYLSIVWGLIVWIFGEGMGGLLNGSATFYNGAPGSVMIYVLLSIILLVPIFKNADSKLFAKVAGFFLILFGLIYSGTLTSNLLLITMPVLLGLWLVLKPNLWSASIALIFLFFTWWLGQNFGNLSTIIAGTSTDPNTAPILMMFLIPTILKFN